MTNLLQCISPIDGSLYAERPALTPHEAAQAVARARRAQKSWGERPLHERIALVRAGVAKIGEQNAEIVTELSWQMGRPVRYGGEFRGFQERAHYMADIV